MRFSNSTRNYNEGRMDLTGVIVELRSELESIDEAIASLGKLADIRKRRHAEESDTESDPTPLLKRVVRAKRAEVSGPAQRRQD